MVIDDEVRVDARFVVTGPGFVYRRSDEVGEVLGEDLAGAFVELLRDPTIAQIGVFRRAAASAHAEAAMVRS